MYQCPECSATGMGQFPICKLKWDFQGLPLQLVQMIKMYFLPHLESIMWERKFEKKFFKKSLIHPPNGVLPICKLPFQNGSYRNGVCRALWALIEPALGISIRADQNCSNWIKNFQIWLNVFKSNSKLYQRCVMVIWHNQIIWTIVRAF